MVMSPPNLPLPLMDGAGFCRQGFALSGAVRQTATLSAAATLILTLQQDAGVPPYSASANFTITAAPLSPLSVSVLYVPVWLQMAQLPQQCGLLAACRLIVMLAAAAFWRMVLCVCLRRFPARCKYPTVVISDDYSQTGDLSVVLSASVFRARSPLPGVFFGNGAAVTPCGWHDAA